MRERLCGRADLEILPFKPSPSPARIQQQHHSMPRKPTHLQPIQKLELDLTPAEREAILKNLFALPSEYCDMLANADPGQPIVLTPDELEDFSGYVAAESNHTTSRKLRKALDSVYEKMTTLLDRFTKEGPSNRTPSRTPRVAKVKDRATAQQRKTSGDSAVYIATWAATMLRAAESHGVLHKVLRQYVPNDLDRLVLSTLPSVSPDIRKRVADEKDCFTVSEVAGMLMAISEEMSEAPMRQQVGLLMVSQSLMIAMQEWVSETTDREAAAGDASAGKAPTRARPSKAARKKPAVKKKPRR
jgi:hypothetical protein